MRPTPLVVQPRALRALAAIGLALALTTCARDAAGPRHAAFSVSPVLPAGLSLAAFNLTVDNVRLIVVRSPADTVVDQTFAFPANQSSVQISADVPLEQSPETFAVTIQLLSASTPLFAGTQPVTLTAGATPPPTPIPVGTYIGPGQTVATLTIDPLDSVLTQGGTLRFRLTAKDAQGVTVDTFYASWSTSDTNVAKVDPTGVLTAPATRATVTVTARTPKTASQPNGVAASTPITFVPTPTTISAIGGCPQSGAPGAQLPQPFVVQVNAADGQGVRGVRVQFSASSGSGSVTPASDTTNSLGQTQALLTLGATPGANVFQASVAGVATAATCNATALGATQLAFTTQSPSSVTAGAPFTVAVTARDALGNPVTSFAGDVTLAIGANPGGASFAPLTVPAVNGVATFANITVDKAGTAYTLVASSSGLTSATSAPFNVTPGPATQLVFTQQPPATVGAGAGFTVVVTARDGLGNTAAGFAGNVSIAIGTNPSGGVLGGTATVTAAAGVATFNNLSIDKAGSGYTLVASSGALTSAPSTAFNVTAGAASQLVITQQPPASVLAGTGFTVVVTARDGQGNTAAGFTGNVSITIGTNPSGGALGGTTTVAAAAGLATFTNLSIDKTGSGYTLIATSGALTSAPSTVFNVTAGAASQLVITQQPPATVAAGAGFTVVVTARDGLGNTAAGFAGNVSITIGTNPSGGALGGTTTVAAAAGLATFTNLTIDKAGSGYTLVASSGALTSAPSTAFNVTAGAATHLLFTVQPVTTPSGSAITPAVVVLALDSLGNTVPTFAGTVTMSIDSGPAGAQLTGTLGVSAVAGVATFANLSLDKAGFYHLRAHATGLTDAISARFDVTIGLSRVLSFTVQPANVTAGSVITPPVQVTVKDLQGNTDATFNGNVVVAIATNPGGGTLSGIDTVAASAGVATFSSLSIDKSGVGYTLQATATGLTTGTSNTFTVSAGAAAKLAYLVPPSTVGVNAPITPAVVVAIEDALGNIVTTATNQVALSIGVNPGNATLGGATTVAAVNGLATFADLTLDQPGTGYTLVAALGRTMTVTSPPFDVLPGATQFRVQVLPDTIIAGASADVQVTALDGNGNTVTSYTGTITFSSSDPLATLPADYTFTPTDAGTHPFKGGVVLRTAPSVTVHAFDTKNSGIFGFTGVTVNPGAANKLAFTLQPVDVVQNATMSPAVQVAVEDQFGNVVPTATNPVGLTIANNPGGGTLTGGLAVAAVNGIASFPRLSIDQAGTGYTLQAASSGLTGATSTAFNVLPAATKQWTGAVSTDWSSTGNWNGGIPTSSDDVLIPSGLTNYPTLSASSATHNLTMADGTSIETAGFPLDVFGNLDAPIAQITGTGTVLLDGTGVTLQGILPNVQVGGTVKVIGPVSVQGDLDITGTGVVDLGSAQTILVTGAITTGSTAVLVDTGGSAISIEGDALFSGGSEAGKLTNGTLQLMGNLTQNGDPESYNAQSGFVTQFVGTGTQLVTFTDPGTGAGVSHFGVVHVANTGLGVSLGSAAFADGSLLAVGSGGVQALMLGNGHSLTVQGITLDSLTIDNMPLVVTNSAQSLFAQDVTFQNFSDASATQLDITRTSGSATFTNLNFLGTPPNPGWHLQVHDPLIGNGAFTVTLITPTPTAANGGRFNATPEAVIISP